MAMAEFEYPSPSDPEIERFRELHSLGQVEQLEFVAADSRYRKYYCHASAKHAAQAGGKRVYGWALWKHKSGCIVGNFHSVWEDESGKLIEVAPPKMGSKTLFIRHDIFTIKKSGQNHELFNGITSRQNRKIIDRNGNPTSEKRFKLPGQEDLKEYCKGLGWPDANLV